MGELHHRGSRCYQDTTLTFIARLGFLQRLKVGFAIATLLEPPDVLLEELSKLTETLDKINTRRNEIVHSKWGLSSRGSDFAWRFSYRVWPAGGYGFDEEHIPLIDLKAFADRIDAAADEISRFACEFGGFMIQSGIEHGRTEYDWKTGAKKLVRTGRPRKGKPPAVAKRKP
jgi:hypothetical protein